jgi:hypothetical protein
MADLRLPGKDGFEQILERVEAESPLKGGTIVGAE